MRPPPSLVSLSLSSISGRIHQCQNANRLPRHLVNALYIEGVKDLNPPGLWSPLVRLDDPLRPSLTIPWNRFMIAEGFRLSNLIISVCSVEDRELQTIASCGPRLHHLEFTRCVFGDPAFRSASNHANKITDSMISLFRSVTALTSLKFSSNARSGALLARGLLGATPNLGRLSFVAAEGHCGVFDTFCSKKLEYLLIHNTARFFPSLTDILLMLQQNAHTLISVSFRGMFSGPLIMGKFWDGFAHIKFTQLRYLELGIPMTTSMLPKLGTCCPHLAFLDLSGCSCCLETSEVALLELRSDIPSLLAVRDDSGWSIYDELYDSEPSPPHSVARMIEEDLPIDTIWQKESNQFVHRHSSKRQNEE